MMYSYSGIPYSNARGQTELQATALMNLKDTRLNKSWTKRLTVYDCIIIHTFMYMCVYIYLMHVCIYVESYMCQEQRIYADRNKNSGNI